MRRAVMALLAAACARTTRAMATTSDALASLAQRKAAFLGTGDATRTVVVGNRAGDLDSIASALAVAHLTSGVAVAQFARRDLALRRDASKALDFLAAGDALVFADELDADVAERRRVDELWLTDHNCVDASFPLAGAVVGIVDHHADEGAHASAGDRDVDAAAGSCSSLVAERLVKAGSASSSLGALLLFAIVLDCRGFDAKFQGTKFSPRDVAAAHALLDALGGLEETVARSEGGLRARLLPATCRLGGAATVAKLSGILSAARFDVAGLTSRQLLALDYKHATVDGLRVGAANIFLTLVEFAAQAGGEAALSDALRDFAENEEVDVLFAMTKHDATAGGRALVYYATKGASTLEAGLAALPRGLSAALLASPLFVEQGVSTSGLGVAAFEDVGDSARACALDEKTSRKTVLPAILHLLGARGPVLDIPRPRARTDISVA